MTWLAFALWFWKCLFTCGHRNTPINEGKCYCPDCGRGLIYRWVVLRCPECRVRRESRYLLRQVVPLQRCCPYCGMTAFQEDSLESPAYFQLRKAWLVAREEPDYQPASSGIHASVHPIGQAFYRAADGFRNGLRQTWLLIEPARPPAKALALLPIRTQP